MPALNKHGYFERGQYGDRSERKQEAERSKIGQDEKKTSEKSDSMKPQLR